MKSPQAAARVESIRNRLTKHVINIVGPNDGYLSPADVIDATIMVVSHELERLEQTVATYEEALRALHAQVQALERRTR